MYQHALQGLGRILSCRRFQCLFSATGHGTLSDTIGITTLFSQHCSLHTSHTTQSAHENNVTHGEKHEAVDIQAVLRDSCHDPFEMEYDRCIVTDTETISMEPKIYDESILLDRPVDINAEFDYVSDADAGLRKE